MKNLSNKKYLMEHIESELDFDNFVCEYNFTTDLEPKKLIKTFSIKYDN